MKKLAYVLSVLFVCFVSSFALSAEQKSAYGIDYHKITYPQIITDFMYGIEPKLIEYYDTLKLTEKQKIHSLNGIAGSLTLNHMFKTLVEDIAATDPEATFVFTKLPKDDYSNLHLLAEYFRQKKEYKDKYGVELTKEEAEKSLKLYKALFGKDYNH
ncbi:hypothetical protein CWB89_06480 [Pseudoalteromonas piscicida]|uniref:Uncharacterized protein n=1 Tax=Pseudoalteromonas piscicida TaxID=43662 RepID=A0AAQ2EU98_PSEO7|nr:MULTISPECIES: hypothetical protein [Pseudoalteromonas]KJY90340.1 hypothetical protein TW75_06800 [Pseudoalteromonas piscicida]TMN42686.1 hypothetical protein CWB95_06975 [Pseudoalteromonas piscicida]TMN44031.1 hypothetical protein CWB94_01395 [Pseudoalteromonas piscicida]TMN56852.1 hypothetical protein CWB92_01810 [Pseudoalteromonas piscicida]TMN57403.1 hypothetical protein CWB91_03355 [Pseudoalteromonas piscicida]